MHAFCSLERAIGNTKRARPDQWCRQPAIQAGWYMTDIGFGRPLTHTLERKVVAYLAYGQDECR